MIERSTIEGRAASIVYLTTELQPAPHDDASLVKIVFDDGEIRFAVQSEVSSEDVIRRGRTVIHIHRDRRAP